jgi:uncharacterized membrane protein YphA (DoxX/SURF4 family)
MNREWWFEMILRAGLAFAFLYPPFAALRDPSGWLGYFPSFIKGIVPDLVLLHSFGAVEVIIALWILSGWKIFLPSLVAALMLLSIITLDWNEFEILFRDVSIMSIAIALAVRHMPGSSLVRESIE